MKKLSKLILLVISFCVSFSLNAQNRTLSGVVTDVNNEPLIGVNVIEKGTTNGTVTNYDGEFEFEATANSTIVFTYIGF